jgi:dolichol-phosphate mannosyltransferase
LSEDGSQEKSSVLPREEATSGTSPAESDPMPRARRRTPPARVSIIVPTYREAESIPLLIERIEPLRRQGFEIELLLMDDDSSDGTEEAVRSLGKDWVRLVVRKTDRGLSRAVLDGLRIARFEHLVVMDADLSHPPEAIPALIDQLDQGAEMVFGSRYVPGGSTAEGWGLLRWLNSKIATLLARPFTGIRDPMAGLFALKRERFALADPLNPVGFKIGLELLVKCRCRDVREVPIHFAKRKFGQSKLTLKEQVKYLRHLRLLAMYKYFRLARRGNDERESH